MRLARPSSANRTWRIFARGLGVILLALAGLVAIGWFYLSAPMRETADPHWVARHSQAEYWHAVQTQIHRGVWLHDDGFTVGRFGDKAWAEWIMSHVQPGDGMDCFGRLAHSAHAMQCLTNHDLGTQADAWLAWWAKHRAETQPQWMAAGFAARGLKIDLPPTPEQTSDLLTALGRLPNAAPRAAAGASADAPEAAPETATSSPSGSTSGSSAEAALVADELHDADFDPFQYNAFRCLRDSGFDPVAYALDHRGLTAEVERGLKVYRGYEVQWPRALELGRLPLAGDGDAAIHYEVPLLRPRFQALVYTLIVVPALLGVELLLWAVWAGRRGDRSLLAQGDRSSESVLAER